MATATVPPNSPSLQPSRRALLSAVGVVGGTVAAVHAVPADAVDLADSKVYPDPHPAWWREATALRDWLDTAEDIEDAACTAPFARMCELHDLIAETPARTATGAATQLAYLAYIIRHNIPEAREMEALASARAVLERPGG